MESEEGEKREKPTKKRKRAEKKKDQALTGFSGESDSSEGGGFEANSEQRVLSPTID